MAPKGGKKSRKVKELEEAASRQPEAEHFLLSLFVSGSAPNSIRALRNIKTVCEKRLQDRYELRVIDVYQHPEQVRSQQIIATPTLVVERPVPIRILIGDLSDTGRLLLALGIVLVNAAI